MGTALYCLVYYSKVSPNLIGAIDDVIGDILVRARTLNALNEVTGILIYNEKIFLQALEGSYKAVEETYARIAKDLRHTELRVVYREQVNERSFGSWTMCASALSLLDKQILNRLQQNSEFRPDLVSGVSTLTQLQNIAHIHETYFNRQLAEAIVRPQL